MHRPEEVGIACMHRIHSLHNCSNFIDARISSPHIIAIWPLHYAVFAFISQLLCDRPSLVSGLGILGFLPSGNLLRVVGHVGVLA